MNEDLPLTPEEEAELAQREALEQEQALSPEEEAELQQRESGAQLNAYNPSTLERVAGYIKDQFTGKEGFVTTEIDPVTGQPTPVGHGQEKNPAYYAGNALQIGGGIAGSLGGAALGMAARNPRAAVLGSSVFGSAGNELGKEAAVRMGLYPENIATPRSSTELVKDIGTGGAIDLATSGLIGGGMKLGGAMAGRAAQALDINSSRLASFIDKDRQTLRMLTNNVQDFERNKGQDLLRAYRNVEEEIWEGVPVEARVLSASEGGKPRMFPALVAKADAAADTRWGPTVGVVVEQADGTITPESIGLKKWYEAQGSEKLPAEMNRALNSVYGSIKKMIAGESLPPDMAREYAYILDAADSAEDQIRKASVSGAYSTVSERSQVQALELLSQKEAYENLINQQPLSARSVHNIRRNLGALSRFDKAQLSNLEESGKAGYYRDAYGVFKDALNSAIESSQAPAFQINGALIPRQQALEIFKEANQKYSDLQKVIPLLEKRSYQEAIEGPFFREGAFGSQERMPQLPWYKRIPVVSQALSADAMAASDLSNVPTVRAQYSRGAVDFPLLRGWSQFSRMGANRAVNTRDVLRGGADVFNSPAGPLISQMARTEAQTGAVSGMLAHSPVAQATGIFLPRDASAQESSGYLATKFGQSLMRQGVPMDVAIGESLSLKAQLEDKTVSAPQKNELLKMLSKQVPDAFEGNPDMLTSVWDGKFNDPFEQSYHIQNGLKTGDLTREADIVGGALAGRYVPIAKTESVLPIGIETEAPLDLEYIDESFQMPEYTSPEFSLSAGSSPDEDLVAKLKKLSAGTDLEQY